jgi:hypothetical protein
MTNINKIATLASFFLLANQYAHAAEPKVIAFSCLGEVKIITPGTVSATPEPIDKLSLIVNFAKKTVSFAGNVARINKVDAGNVSFSDERKPKRQDLSLVPISISGDIDRVTGVAHATTYSAIMTSTWDMSCKPMKRRAFSWPLAGKRQ